MNGEVDYISLCHQLQDSYEKLSKELTSLRSAHLSAKGIFKSIEWTTTYNKNDEFTRDIKDSAKLNRSHILSWLERYE